MAGKSFFGGKQQENVGDAISMEVARDIVSDYVALALTDAEMFDRSNAALILDIVTEIKRFSFYGLSSTDQIVEFESALHRKMPNFAGDFIRNGIGYLFSHLCSFAGPEGINQLVDDICYGISIASTQLDPTVSRKIIDASSDTLIQNIVEYIKRSPRLIFFEILKHTYIEVNVIREEFDGTKGNPV